MRKISLIFTLSILILCSQTLFAQDNENLQLIFSIEEPNCERLLSLLDNLAEEARKFPNAAGYVAIFGGANPISAKFYEKHILLYARFRKFENRYSKVLHGKREENLRIEFWLSKNGEKPKIEKKDFGNSLPNQTERYLFVEDYIKVLKTGRKIDYTGSASYSHCDLSSFDLWLLRDLLEANPKMNAEISVFNKRKRNADRLINLILNDITADLKIPRNRVRIFYGGTNKIDFVVNNNTSYVKVLLVPAKNRK